MLIIVGLCAKMHNMNNAAPQNAKTCLLFLALGALMPMASAKADLAHRYNLNGNGTDSVAGSNGTLTSPGGTASFSATAFTTTGANGTDFLTLPSSIGTGITGDFSVEDWLTQNGGGGAFASVFSLSTSTSNFILLNPNRNGGGTTADFQQAGVTGGGNGSETNATTTQANFQPFGTERDILLTYASATGLASVYNNGTLIGSATIGAGFNFQTATAGTFDGINGNDAFADPNFNGSTDDFRIYSQALTPAQVSALSAAGPNATNAQITAVVPEPSSLMAMLGIGALTGMRRLRRRST